MNSDLFEIVDEIKEPDKQIFKISRNHLVIVEFKETFEIEGSSFKEVENKLLNSVNNEEYLFKHDCEKIKAGSVFKNDDLTDESYDEEEYNLPPD